MEKLLMKIAQNQVTTNEMLEQMQRDINQLNQKTDAMQKDII